MSFLLSTATAGGGGLHPGGGLHSGGSASKGGVLPPSDTTGYGQHADSTHPTGMYSCRTKF